MDDQHGVGVNLLAERSFRSRSVVVSVHNDMRLRRSSLSANRPVDRSNTVLEFAWRAPITDCPALQPTLQYIAIARTDHGTVDVPAIGMRFELATAWSR